MPVISTDDKISTAEIVNCFLPIFARVIKFHLDITGNKDIYF